MGVGLVVLATFAAGCKSSAKTTSTGAKPPATGASSTATSTATSAAGVAPPAASGTVPDVCSILSTSTVGGILGHHVTAESSPGVTGQSLCDYTDGAGGYPVQVDLENSDASGSYQAYKSVANNSTNLPGIGDQAFGDATGVHVLSGSYYIEVNGPAGAVLSGDYTKASAVAKALIAALP